MRGKAVPPPPPSKRPISRKQAPASPARDSGYSANDGASDAVAAPAAGGASIAGGLAEALRQRSAAMHAKEDEDEW